MQNIVGIKYANRSQDMTAAKAINLKKEKQNNIDIYLYKSVSINIKYNISQFPMRHTDCFVMYFAPISSMLLSTTATEHKDSGSAERLSETEWPGLARDLLNPIDTCNRNMRE